MTTKIQCSDPKPEIKYPAMFRHKSTGIIYGKNNATALALTLSGVDNCGAFFSFIPIFCLETDPNYEYISTPITITFTP